MPTSLVYFEVETSPVKGVLGIKKFLHQIFVLLKNLCNESFRIKIFDSYLNSETGPMS